MRVGVQARVLAHSAERAQVVLLDRPDRELQVARGVSSSEGDTRSTPTHDFGRIYARADNLQPDLGALLDHELRMPAGQRTRRGAEGPEHARYLPC